MLRLGYSAVGFHVVALVAMVPLAVYGTMGRVTWSGLLRRGALAAVIFGVCALCRSSCLSLLPGYALALAVGARRLSAAPAASPSRWSRRGMPAALAAGTLLMLPLAYAALAVVSHRLVANTLARQGTGELPPQRHDVWATIWQGLGDFDRTKGYVFLDSALDAALRSNGREGSLNQSNEAILRDRILGDIRSDPAWYLGILARRTWATVTLSKLAPWGPRDGASIKPATHPNEGVTDSYYVMAAQADWYGIAGWTWEVPIECILFPTLLIVIAAAVPRTPQWGKVQQYARCGLLVCVCVAVGALVAPVLITTATAFESESFVVAHLLSLAFVGQGLLCVVRAAYPLAKQ
jgi:hypothetical protein